MHFPRVQFGAPSASRVWVCVRSGVCVHGAACTGHSRLCDSVCVSRACDPSRWPRYMAISNKNGLRGDVGARKLLQRTSLHPKEISRLPREDTRGGGGPDGQRRAQLPLLGVETRCGVGDTLAMAWQSGGALATEGGLRGSVPLTLRQSRRSRGGQLWRAAALHQEATFRQALRALMKRTIRISTLAPLTVCMLRWTRPF